MKRALSIALTIALLFGQVGAGFFHNKHDAHEAVVDLDQTVLVPHGEHCKVCAVDWVHQFVASSFEIVSVEEAFNFPKPISSYSFLDFSRHLTKDRAPPVIA
jgi:hypothetical protein